MFVWHGLKSAAAPLPYGPLMQGSGERVCIVVRRGSSGERPRGGGASCGSVAEVSKNGVVDVSETGQNQFWKAGEKLYRTVAVLVPNGVTQVTFTDSNGRSYSMPVSNNVVINDDQHLAEPPTSAVSYRLPDGSVEHVVMPGPPAPPASGEVK